MNADQLGQIVSATIEAIEKSEVIARLNEFNAAFDNLVSQSNEAHQQQFNDARKALLAALDSEHFHKFPNTWRTALEELGLYELIGPQLKQRINDLINDNQLTPVIARDEIKLLASQLGEYRTEFQKIHEAFDYLKLGGGKPDPGEGVLSVLMPREYYQGELTRFAGEIERLSEMAGWLSELVTGKSDMPKVKELSTTDPWILVSMFVGTVLLFLEIVERIQNIRLSTQNLKQFKKQAEELETSQAVKKAIQSDVDKIVETQLKEIHDWIFSTYNKVDNARLNELKDPIEKKLTWLADGLDHGYEIDGDAGEVDEESGLPDAEKSKYSDTVKRIQEVSVNIKYLETPSEPVLMLAKQEQDTKQKARSTKAKSDKKAAAPKPDADAKSKSNPE